MAEEVLDEEQDEQECPKCPPAGAPAWMATFADMATLLMAFFVLILSFAEFNVPKFKQITVIALEFSPNPSPSISETLRQDTTELQQPNLVIPEKDDIAPDGSEDDKDKDSDFEGAGGEGAEQLDATELAKQLKKAIDTGEVTVETLGENVVINFPEEKTSDEKIQTMVAEALEALNEAREKSGSMESEVLFGGIEQQLEKLASTVDSDDPNDGDGQGGSSAEQAEKVQNASRTTEELTVALREQID
ncbi:MAG: flagellar motor protein MotB, partial [Rhodobacterales bacterium]|nr:flagellar motor protein MotB [Rhodobacterales bacterium]